MTWRHEVDTLLVVASPGPRPKRSVYLSCAWRARKVTGLLNKKLTFSGSTIKSSATQTPEWSTRTISMMLNIKTAGGVFMEDSGGILCLLITLYFVRCLKGWITKPPFIAIFISIGKMTVGTGIQR